MYSLNHKLEQGQYNMFGQGREHTAKFDFGHPLVPCSTRLTSHSVEYSACERIQGTLIHPQSPVKLDKLINTSLS